MRTKFLSSFSLLSYKNLNHTALRVMLVMFLTVLCIGQAWGSAARYGRGNAYLKDGCPTGAGQVYVAVASSSSSSNSGWQDCITDGVSAQLEGAKTAMTFTFQAKVTSSAYKFTGWYNKNADGTYSLLTKETKYSVNKTTGAEPTGYSDVFTDVNCYAEFIKIITYSFVVPEHGNYTITNNGVTVANYAATQAQGVVHLVAQPDEGYRFAGWYTTSDGGTTKNYFSFDSEIDLNFTTDVTVGVDFQLDNGNALFYVVNGGMHNDLASAIAQANTISPKIVTVAQDGNVPAGNYTIPSGVTLYVPYSKSNSYQTTPTVVTAASALNPYRVLTLQDGVNITCNGNICVGGQIMSAGGGKASAYPTGACGVMDMSKGGNITLNNGAKLYCWGFIKGQDMEQGNNTVGAGSIIAKSGSVVWEMFAVGDWRGGMACSTIESNSSSWRFFPFQSYTIQNIEVQTTYEYGSTLSNYTNVFGDGSTNEGSFALIGSTNTLFLLKDSESKLKKWYDPTTDLVCYEMSGTTQLDAINISVMGISVSSKDYNLPISSSMHVIMNSNATISKPMVVQAGAVIEVKSGYTLTCSSNVYIFDKDNWGEYCNKKYYYTMTNLTSHKNRGNGTSNELIDDAKLIIDGTLNVTGKMYTTAGGADIMSNGGGKIVFSTLPTSTNIVMCTGVSDNEDVPVASANLHNEDDSYTQVRTANSTFYNVNGRWFVAADKDEKSNHTYNFTYITSGAVSGTGGTSGSTPAVYSWDKTGLVLQQKWHNVSADACPNWWVGTDTYFYNWTLNSDWHQFMPTATEGMYSGSNNKIYTKTDCAWEPLGETDVNCLYTIGGVKKALVDGEFIALEPNNNDPAYHAADDDTKYYICFEGCNWHAADKYTEEEKTYIIAPDTFIWYNDAWMSVNFQKPFAYTLSETNVPIYYEYLNGEWVLAEPYVRVVDGIESRDYWFIQDAFTFASGALRKNPTIKILRDISDITTAVTYSGTNKICTLDLNGHTITGSVSSMITVNAAGCTFNIEDNTTEKNGKINLVFSANNSRRYALNVKNGHVILKSGTISGTCTLAYNKTSAPKPLTGCVVVAAGKQFTMDGGKVEAVAPYNPIAIVGSEGTPTITINAGTVEAVAQTIDSPYGIQSYGTINFNEGTVNVTAEKSSTAIGIYVHASAKAQGTLNMIGGTINATSYTKNTRGVYVNKAFAYDTNEPRSITVVYPAFANISGGEINATNITSTDAEGIYSLGNTTVTGGEINARCSANTTAIGIRVLSGETRVSGSTVINATATGTVYGIRVSKETPAIAGTVYNSTLQMDGGTINAQATTGGKAYGIYVGAATLANTATHASNSKSYAGNYANAGTATITGGTVHATAHTNTAYGVFVDAEVTESDAAGYATASATPKCTINGGYFTAEAAAPAAAVQPVDATVLAENFKIAGGYYSHDDNLNIYAVSPKHSVALQETDANYDPYFYKVAESYSVTFKNGSDVLQSGYQEKGKTPVYNGDAPTKASTSTTSYIFDGWSTTDGGAKVSPLPNVTSAGATYYAHYSETALKYIVTFDAKTNGGAEETTVTYVEPSSGVGTLPTATKEGHTFSGWFTAASGGTKITTATVPTGDATYYAQFTVNKYTLTWELGNGVVSAVGKYGSTSWPAKKATGTQSKAVSYGLTLTAPTVTRTGYTFHSWAPLVAATMPAEAVTYTAQWNPKTNTAYTVKHYQQNVDGTYPEEPVETEALTGTTGESVTPEVKEYEGFVSPETETKEIAADGTMVIEYKYERMHYTITLDAATNGGTSEQATIEVIHGATIGTVPPDAQKGCNDFTGWYTKPVGGVKITSDFTIEYNLKTLYAQFSSEVRKYTITYAAGANGTGSVASTTKTCGVDITLSSSTFTRTGYTQTGWSLTDGGTKAYELGAAYTDNKSRTLYPFWKRNTYTILWKSEDGSSTLETDANQEYGTATAFNGTTPTKDATAQYIYTFDGWATAANGDKVYEIGATPTVSAAATYYAHFAATLQKYTVSVAATPAGYGTVSAATVAEVPFGTAVTKETNKITVNGKTITATPTTATAQYTYAFSKWNNVPATVTGNVSIEAVFTRTVNNYTVTWKNEDGTVLETDASVAYGNTPTFDGATPTKKTTEEYTYTFKEWTPAISNVTGDVTYTATYTATPNVASVTVGGATTYYPTIADAWEAVNTATGAVTLKLLQDVSGITTSLAYTNAQNCTLDLNNHTILGSVSDRLLEINAAGKTFTIDDSSAEKGGRLENSKAGKARYYAVYLSAGILNLEHGTIHSSNPSDATYSTLTSNAKKCTVSGVYVTAKQTFNMNGGAVSASAIYNPIGVQTAGVTNLKRGSVTATATKFTTAVGVHSTSTTKIYDGVTITASSAKSTTVYGVQVAGSTTTFYGGTIKAHATSSKGTTVSGIYVSSGTASIPATSTVDVEAKSYGKNCYGVQVAGGKRANIYGGTFSATSTNANAAYSVYSLGTTNITGGTFTATAKTSNARGVSVPRGTTTISGDPEFTVRAPNSVYGALASATTPSKAGVSYYGTLIIKGGTFDVEATSTTTAFGVYAGQGTGLSMFSTTNDSVPGNYINAGTAEISGGVFNVTAKTTTAYGVFVNKGTQNKNTTMDAVTASGTCTVTGGKFNISATSSVGAVNTVAANTDLIVTGGWYNVATNLATKYTAPKKDCNYHVLPLTGEDPYKYEVAEAYMITFKNGDDVLQSTAVKKGTMPVYSGEEPSKAADAQYTYAFTGWDNALVAVTEAATYTATFTQTVNKYTITWVDGNGVTLKTEDLEYGTTPSYTGDTPTKTEDENYKYTFNGTWSPAITSVTGDATYTAQFNATSKETGDHLDIVDWTATTLTINANGWKASGWPYTINGTAYEKGNRAEDRTLTINYSGAAGTELSIKLQDKDEKVISLHKYRIPFIGTADGVTAEDTIYVNSGTLDIDANTLTNVGGLYVRPEASVNITNSTLTIGKLVLRTLPWQAASISGDFTATKTYYTRIAPNKRKITDIQGKELSYEAASYYQFALPLGCEVALKDVKVSNHANTPYGNTWLLKRYNEKSRAVSGTSGDNWVALGEDANIQGGVGYEMFSNSAYYREFYFPVGTVSSATLGTTTTVAYDLDKAGVNHAGWNIVASPLMGVYDNSEADPETGLKVSWYLKDGSYDQVIPSYIYPAIPFTYQATANQSSISFAGSSIVAAAPRRVAAGDEEVRLQWLHLDIKAADGIGDQTSILSHPTRYEESYKTGIDVAKQSLTASRAILYSTHAYGDMAFAGVSDSKLTNGIPLVVYSPKAQELTISMRENNWLNRLTSVWLIDHETGIRTDLLWSTYTFDATEGTAKGRFTLMGEFKAPQVTTGLENGQSEQEPSTKARKVIIEDKIYIQLNGHMYDSTGKKVN